MRANRFRRYHWPRTSSLDSFEDFDSHWSRGKRFGRPKLKFASVTHFQNPILAKYAPDWDFAQILVHFWKILISRRWLLLALRRHLRSIPNGCRVCLQSIWSCFECMLQVLLLKIEIISKNRLRHTSLEVSSAKGKGRSDVAKSNFRALGPGWRFGDTANAFQCVCGCI